MPFLAYIAVILVSLGGILFELNWLTSPKLETKPAVQASRLTTSPKQAEATPAPREVETQPSEPAPNTAASTPPQQIAQQPPQQTTQQTAPVPPITPAPAFSAAETTGIGPTDFKREFNNDAKADSSTSTATFTPAVATPAVAASSSSKCDIAACSAAYQSFRASDCSYQPMDGNARKVCDRTQGSAQQANIQPTSAPVREHKAETAVRNNATRTQSGEVGKEARLRAFEREVRRITASEAALDTGTDRSSRSQVIVIERPAW